MQRAVRRDLFLALGGYEPAFRGMYEDQAFHAKLCLAHPVFVASECTYRYRQHPDLLHPSLARERLDRAARVRYVDWLRRYLGTAGRAGRDFAELHDSLPLTGAQER